VLLLLLLLLLLLGCHHMIQVLESKGTDLGGIKSATALVSGSGVFGQFRWESGVHRATMVPDNDKFGRMQTGTAVVIALPEVSEVIPSSYIPRALLQCPMVMTQHNCHFDFTKLPMIVLLRHLRQQWSTCNIVS
jgi:hypothetical protein